VKPFIVGVGRAGCRIADLFLKESTGRVPMTGLLVDTEASELSFYPHRERFLLGKNLLDGNGTGKNVDMGREAVEADRYAIVENIDHVKSTMDAIFVVAGLGGGTGGSVDILLEELRRSYVEPVYCIGVLPSIEDPERVTMNFAKQFKGIVSHSQAVFPVDNDRLKRVNLHGSFNTINREILRHFQNLLEVGEYRSREELGENVLGSSDIVNTLTGVSSIGIGSLDVSGGGGIFGRGQEGADKPGVVVSLTEEATRKMLFNFDVETAQKALAVVSGPRKYLDFLGSIPARLWLEKNIHGCEVRGGDMPSPGRRLTEVTVVLSGIRKSERIRHLYHLGKMLRKKGGYSENVTRLFDRMRSLNAQVQDLEKAFGEVFEDVKKLAGTSKEEKKEGEEDIT
jgi:cell division GTPase FtsZ